MKPRINSQKNMESIIEKTATPIITRIARKIAKEETYKVGGFRVKKVTANPQSQIEITPRSGSEGGNVGFYGSVGNTKLTLTGSKGTSTALANLIAILGDGNGGLGLIHDETT